MTLTAALNGVPISTGNVVIPAVGIWHADLVLADNGDTPTAGRLVILLGGATLSATAIRATAFAGRTELRVVGGAAAWRNTVAPKAYGPTSAAAVISDTAATAGELVNPSPLASSMIPAYLRTMDRASKVLQDLAPDTWWMDFSGTMQFGPRPSLPIGSQFDALSVRGAPGRYSIATNTPGDWLPGATFTGPTIASAVTISRVRHVVAPGSLRTEVMAA